MHIAKVDRTPISGVQTRTPVSGGLPEDMVEEAAKRLGFAALVYAVVFLFAYWVSGVPQWVRTGTVRENLVALNSIVAAASILMSVAVFFLSRLARVCPSFLLNFGLFYLIVSSFGIAMAEFWNSFSVWDPAQLRAFGFFGIPWECVWIVIYPVLAPNTCRRTFVAALGAASMGLVTISLSKAFGETSPDAPMGFFVRYFLFSTYLSALVAFFVSQGIQRFGTHLKKARELGNYRLVRQLGRGGMGEVWRAKHRMLARPAAIKLIRPEVLGTDETTRRTLLRRFEREAQATASLQSCHTIDVYDFGITEDGAFYYVMELLDGTDLESFVKRFGPIPAERSVHFLRQVCHSLMDAHENGMIHRDIKPGNVFVCRLGPDLDFVNVLDFGLVKAYEEKEAGDTQLTVQGIAPGTPGYMAPEMALGKGPVDGRSDLYALGCVAYWMVTGETVFEGDTPLATVLKHVQEPPIPPSERTELHVPEPLESIILSCLEKDPANRPQSARELDRQLAEIQTSDGWTLEMAQEWWDLHMPKVEEAPEDIDQDEQEKVVSVQEPTDGETA
jgi:serine/threonine-protein kinase